ncbi:fasciclin [Enterovibrio norvegicus FF-454]|uniref:Fasciclin n=1 Tax=Enterovibrio norvegicus FF-454 TaxID=1185651 RepID=A0A1E5C0U5_9GAMM|nr:fasciclin domain-containing protein [Enterovibrio norvegicus]OEE59136.1 fasciclin [Enterovibrio norvegicus FF-454]
MISAKVLSSVKSTLLATACALMFGVFSVQADHHGMKKNIVEIAASNPDFSTLVAAVEAAGLVETLQGKGPFTVFAPTNEAFAKLPAGTVESLLMPENKDKLISILTYHVVPGKVMAADVIGMTEAPTVQGSMIKVDASNGVKVDNANVVATDIIASNGVIHVIDNVIIPQ